MKIRFTPESALELDEAVKWYENELTGLGKRFVVIFDETLLRAVRYPYFNSEIHPGFYRALMKKFPYGIIYSIENGDLIVYAVAHLHRAPFYWLK